MVYTYIFNIMICKCGHWQKFSLAILFKINKSLQISLYHGIFTFCLPISLKINCDKKPLFDTKKNNKIKTKTLR